MQEEVASSSSQVGENEANPLIGIASLAQKLSGAKTAVVAYPG